MWARMLQNLEAIGCLGDESSALTTPLSATQQGDRSHVLTGTVLRFYLSTVQSIEKKPLVLGYLQVYTCACPSLITGHADQQ